MEKIYINEAVMSFFHKCLKMPKGYSETVKRRWINNTIGVFADLISDVIFTNLHDNKQILGWQ